MSYLIGEKVLALRGVPGGAPCVALNPCSTERSQWVLFDDDTIESVPEIDLHLRGWLTPTEERCDCDSCGTARMNGAQLPGGSCDRIEKALERVVALERERRARARLPDPVPIAEDEAAHAPRRLANLQTEFAKPLRELDERLAEASKVYDELSYHLGRPADLAPKGLDKAIESRLARLRELLG
jgi:hypothetical protein